MRHFLFSLALLASTTAAQAQTAACPSAAAATKAAQGGAGVAAHLQELDEMDYDVFSNQKWEQLHESHGPNVVVHWPDDHITTGLARHINDLKALLVYAPDTEIKQHPVKFGSGEYTGVTGVMTGINQAHAPGRRHLC